MWSLCLLLCTTLLNQSMAAHPNSEFHESTNKLIIKWKSVPVQINSAQTSEARQQQLEQHLNLVLNRSRKINNNLEVLELPERIPRHAAQQIINRLLSKHNIELVEHDRYMQIQATPTDAYYSLYQWHYYDKSAEIGAANLPNAWDITTGSNDIVVAVIDTGILPHIDLVDRVLPGYDFISDPAMANDGDGLDSDATDAGDWITADEAAGDYFGCQIRDSSWHGTHVAGTIGAAANNGGAVGVNWVSKIVPIRVLGKCGGSFFDIYNAMRWAAGLPVEGVPDNPNPADVINMSLGTTGNCAGTTLQAVIDEIVTTTNTTIVAAAGNSNADAANYLPASCNNVITVAASNRAGGKASYSNYGTSVTLAAPGGDFPINPDGVLSTFDSGLQAASNNNTYGFSQGTSMAAPHVTGVVSLMQSAYHDLTSRYLTPTQLSDKITLAARAFPTTSGANCTTNTCGAGLLDAKAALDAVTTLPVADAGDDQTVSTSALVTLDATNSYDDASINSYLWTQTSGTPVTLNNATSATANFTSPLSADNLVFQVSITDDIGLNSTSSVSIQVVSDNNPPTAQNSAITLDEDTLYNGTLPASDIGNGNLTYEIVSQGELGYVNITNINTGSYTYTPAEHAHGIDSFTFRVSDGQNYSNTATVSITINAINDRPLATILNFELNEDAILNQALNGEDIENSPITFALIANPVNGDIELNPVTGSFTYIPLPNFNGTDSFSYIANDGELSSLVTSVSLNVIAQNDIPLSRHDSYTTNEDVAFENSLYGNDFDNDSLSYSLVNQPANGTITSFNTSTGQFEYTPIANYHGQDSFSYQVSDGISLSTASTISITVNSINDPATPEAYNIILDEDSDYFGQFIANDVENDILTFSITNTPSKGTVTLLDLRSGEFIYTPYSNDTGSDQFTFSVTDGKGLALSATASIEITAVNDSPSLDGAGTYGVILTAGSNVDIPLSIHDPDIATHADQHNLTSSVFNLGNVSIANQTLSIHAVTPGQETLVITVTDSYGSSGTMSLPVTINDTQIIDNNQDGISDELANQLGLNPDTDLGDSDGDTIADKFEIGDPLNPIDNDNDNVIDALEQGDLALNEKVISFKINEQSANKIKAPNLTNKTITLSTESGIRLISHNNPERGTPLHAIEEITIPDTSYDYPYGVYDFSVELPETSSSAVVTLQLPSEVELNSNIKVRKLDNTNTWRNFTHFTLDYENNAILLTLNDNDSFDLDPSVGIIRDPVGIAVSKELEDSTNNNQNSSNGGGGHLQLLLLVLLATMLIVKNASIRTSRHTR